MNLGLDSHRKAGAKKKTPKRIRTRGERKAQCDHDQRWEAQKEREVWVQIKGHGDFPWAPNPGGQPRLEIQTDVSKGSLPVK